MAEGIKELGLDGEGGVVDANIKDCLGSGYCNIGCAYGKKLSALDNILPRAQRDFPGAVRIFSECLAESIRTRGKRATEVRCTLSDGRHRPGRGQDGDRLGRGARVEPAPPAQQPRWKARRHRPLLQRRRAADRRFRGRAQLVRRPSDHPRLPPDGRGPAHPRVLVQPGRDPGAADAGLVLRPLPQHAPLRAT